MNRFSKQFWMTLAFIILAGGAVNFYLRYYHPEFRTQYIGFSGEARKNPWLAAQQLLQQLNIETVNSKKLSLFLQQARAQDILLLTYDKQLSQEESDALIAWVKKGGHLILMSQMIKTKAKGQQPPENADAEEEEETEDFLLTYIGVKQYYHELSDEFVPLKFTWQHHNFTVNFDSYRTLALENPSLAIDFQLSDNKDKYLPFIRFKDEQGTITLITKMAIFNNHQIDKFSHAWFLTTLVTPSKITDITQHPKVWFLNVRVPPSLSLLDLLFKHAKPMLISLCVLLIFALVYTMTRFGFVLPAPRPLRRKLLEHIDATGLFAWRNRYLHHSIEHLQQEIKQLFLLRHNDWKLLSEADFCHALAKQTQLPLAEIQHAFQTQFQYHELLVTEQLKTLQQLKQLAQTSIEA